MNILFFIYSHGQASGGHYHSLLQISKEVARGNEVGIISIGPVRSPVYLNSNLLIKHINVNDKIWSLFSLNKELKQIFNKFKPQVLHCFDSDTLNRLLVLTSTFYIPIVLNKCGGPNPKRKNYYHANAFIVFSGEDYSWFKKNKNYKNELIILIPNRVEKLNLLPESERMEPKDNNKVTFLRVTRIGGAYEKTLLDSYTMIEELMLSYPVQLIVIGRIQNEKRYQWFKKEAEERKLPVKFITDKRASKGSDFLYLADFTIGTGRSFMESLSFGLPTLTPAENTNWPILVDEKNFNSLFRTNFSERNKINSQFFEQNKKNIKKLIENKKEYKKFQIIAQSLFDEHLSSKLILQKYNDVYTQVISAKAIRIKILIKNIPYLVKFYLLDK